MVLMWNPFIPKTMAVFCVFCSFDYTSRRLFSLLTLAFSCLLQTPQLSSSVSSIIETAKVFPYTNKSTPNRAKKLSCWCQSARMNCLKNGATWQSRRGDTAPGHFHLLSNLKSRPWGALVVRRFRVKWALSVVVCPQKRDTVMAAINPH